MNYYNSYMPNPLEKRVKELEEDKKELSQAIEDLNSCYQEKISLLEKTISQQQLKYEELLQWKQNYMDKSLFDIERYEKEIKKMIEILDTAHSNFQEEKDTLIKEIESQALTIEELKEEKQALSQFNTLNESKIQEMVKQYTGQIEMLKQELRELREESIVDSESSRVALREVCLSQNTENMEPSSSIITIKGGNPAQSKISIDTVMEE